MLLTDAWTGLLSGFAAATIRLQGWPGGTLRVLRLSCISTRPLRPVPTAALAIQMVSKHRLLAGVFTG